MNVQHALQSLAVLLEVEATFIRHQAAELETARLCQAEIKVLVRNIHTYCNSAEFEQLEQMLANYLQCIDSVLRSNVIT